MIVWLLLGAIIGQAVRVAIWYAVPAIADWRARRRYVAPSRPSTLASVAETYRQMYASESLSARMQPELKLLRKDEPITATSRIDGPMVPFNQLRSVHYHKLDDIDDVSLIERDPLVDVAGIELERLMSERPAGEVVGLTDWIPHSKPSDGER